MKKLSILFLLTFCVGVISCKKDKEVVDPIFEFVSIAGDEEVNVNEFDNSTVAVPIVVQLWAFHPYNEDVTVNYQVTGNNTTEGVDFTVTPANSIKIPAGKLTSDTIWVKTINNDAGAANPRSFDIKLTGASKSDIKLGLGITDPKNLSVTVNISDDECTLTIARYNAALTNLISIDGNENGTNAATGVVSGSTVALTGDLIWYGAMDNPFVLTLTPESVGATKGSVTFGIQEVGTANDGYEYKFAETVGAGSYNVCSGTITIEYDTSYRAVGETDWTPWQHVKNVIQAP